MESLDIMYNLREKTQWVAQMPSVNLFVDLPAVAKSTDRSLDLPKRLLQAALKIGRIKNSVVYLGNTLNFDPGAWQRMGYETTTIDREHFNLDVYERTLVRMSPPDHVVIVSTDLSRHELIRRLKPHVNTVTLIGTPEMAEHVKRTANIFISIYDVVGLRAPPQYDIAERYRKFVRFMLQAEEKNDYIGLGHLQRELLPQEGITLDSRLSRQLIDMAQEDGVLTVYDWQQNGGRAVRACKLNREHDFVASVLAQNQVTV